MSVEEANAITAAISLAEIAGQATVLAAQDSSRAAAEATTQAATTQAEAERDVATTNANAHTRATQLTADAAKYAADDAKAATEYAADKDESWHERVAENEITWREYVADKDLEGVKYTADKALTTQEHVAETDRTARQNVATTERDAQENVAEKNAEAAKTVATTDAEARKDVATTTGEATKAAAESARQGEENAARTHGDADKAVATIAAGATVQAAEIDAAWHASVATITGSYQVQTAVAEGVWHESVATTELTGTEYGADRQLDGVHAHETAETGRLGLKLGFATTIFTQIEPLIAQIVGGATTFLGGGGLQLPGLGFNPNAQPAPAPKAGMGFRMGPVESSVGGDYRGSYSSRPATLGTLDAPQDSGTGTGSSTTGVIAVGAPYIGTQGVFTPAQLQQQVNQAYSRNDARTQTQIRKAQGDLAGRGFSSNSPILDALRVGYVTANLRASVESASQIRLQASQANNDTVFRAQQARSQQFLAQENVLLDEQRNTITQQVGILQAVASLVGGIL